MSVVELTALSHPTELKPRQHYHQHDAETVKPFDVCQAEHPKDADLTVLSCFQTRVRFLSTVDAPKLRMPGPPPRGDLGRDPDYRLIDTFT